MIGSIRGKLLSASALSAVVETGGLGYEVNVPVTTAERLTALGSEVLLHTHAVYREDSQALYGFSTADERDFFRLLINQVAGVGPKVALALMSRLSLEMLESTISIGDADALSKCPGIGRKTADRIILDLKDKIGASRGVSRSRLAMHGGGTAGSPAIGDAIAALLALGYKAPEAEKAVRKAHASLGDSAPTEALIKRALT
ncbi:MAG TPA: Holliday junction branch migration protein RuvA [Opitutaceae bacterium]|nr:Holliday junction branch migration protein RuvA [Opitutaceae bacterium]